MWLEPLNLENGSSQVTSGNFNATEPSFESLGHISVPYRARETKMKLIKKEIAQNSTVRKYM